MRTLIFKESSLLFLIVLFFLFSSDCCDVGLQAIKVQESSSNSFYYCSLWVVFKTKVANENCIRLYRLYRLCLHSIRETHWPAQPELMI